MNPLNLVLMNPTLFISIFFLVSICNAQKIKVTVNEAQIFAKYGTHTNQAVIDAPDEDRGLKQIDCDYIICNSDPPNVYKNLLKFLHSYNNHHY